MRKCVIIVAILFGINACTSKKTINTASDTKDHSYLFNNPCWGINNLEKMFIKWNWIHLKDTKKYVKEPLFLDFKIVRYNQVKEELFSINLYQSRKTFISTPKQFNLYSTFYTYEIFVKDIKRVLLNDTDFFKNFEFDRFSAIEWEEKEELSNFYGDKSEKGKESYLISYQKNNCASSFFLKPPHALKITLVDSNNVEIIVVAIPLNKIKRAPPYFSLSELINLGTTYRSDLYPATMNISVILEQF